MFDSRFTVSLSPESLRKLAALKALVGLTRTDLINRGISIYCELENELADGSEILIRKQDGTVSKLTWF